MNFEDIEKHLKNIPYPTVDIEGDSDVSFNRVALWHWYQDLIIKVDDLKKTVTQKESKGES